MKSSESILINTKSIFITGSYRSGTTLTEKILNNHNSLLILSQPFPILFIMIKERFDKQNNCSQRYPFDHKFLQDNYTYKKFENFIDAYIFSDDDILEFKQRMKNYIGLWTPDILDKLRYLRKGNFISIYNQLLVFLYGIFPKEKIDYIGTKEVLFEEFIPYLLNKGMKVIHVIRDPRDMIASLNFREKDNQTGKNRPILYSLRNWRKSVAYSIEYEKNKNFLSIKYEDIVLKTNQTLSLISDFLEVDNYSPDPFKCGIKDQYGNSWSGNSSNHNLSGISTKPIGSYKKKLPENVISYIQSICYPELLYKEYINKDIPFNQDIIKKFKDPFENIHDNFSEDYSSNLERVRDELKRYQFLVKKDISKKDVKSWFIFESTFNKLSNII